MPNSKISAGETKPVQYGKVLVKDVTISKKIPLFILFSYSGKSGASSFLAAAKFKKKRLERIYPEAEIEVRIIRDFKIIEEFKTKWIDLYNELEADPKYQLWEVHYFGHGNHECLSLDDKGKNLNFEKEDELPTLPWHPDKGIFVLHSCRGAAYEDSFSQEKLHSQVCLAQRISVLQQTRCLGQVVYANYCALPSQKNIIGSDLTDKEHDSFVKYRPNRVNNSLSITFGADAVLWGYALLTGSTGRKIERNKESYEKAMAGSEKGLYAKYQIYSEVEKLSHLNQIMPCRVFNKGVQEQIRVVELSIFNKVIKKQARVVELGAFNANDLDYI